ncbi:MAG: LacI family transcriptional regulator [Bacilli bacterium]|nr:LacI family transcriptional regulator [Bacilli bacterium]
MAEVSPGTVSNAFKRPEKVAPGTLQRILEISKQLNYSPNQLASALVTSKTKMIGLMVSYAHSASRGSAVNEFIRRASHAGYMVIMASIEMNFEEEETQITRFLQYHVDGVVIYSDFVQGNTTQIKRLSERGIPCVVVKRFDEAYENIQISAQRAFMQISEQIKRFHHKKVGVIVNDYHLSNGLESVRKKRIETFQSTLRDVGLELKEENILCVPEDDLKSGMQAINDWITSGREMPTVFLCMYDHIAIGVIQGLQARGYRVPEDISVIGYGDYEFGEYASPRLATVNPNEKIIMLDALDRLLRRIDDPTLKFENTTIEHSFILRESFGMAPQSN